MASGPQSQPNVDRWTLIHAAVGSLLTAGLWALNLGWWAVLVVAGLECHWEIFENNDAGIWLWQSLKYTAYKGDSAHHTCTDFALTTLSSIVTATVAYGAGAEVAAMASGGFAVLAVGLFFVFLRLA
mgnify:CR=1 FL=1